MGAAEHALRCLAGTINFDNTCKKGGFTLTALSDANWGKHPDNGNRSMSSYIRIMSNGPVSFKVVPQGIMAQLTVKAELVAAALTIR